MGIFTEVAKVKKVRGKGKNEIFTFKLSKAAITEYFYKLV